MEEKLKKGQILYIDNMKYVVINMIEYKEDTWIWQEYEIRNRLNESRWLCVEADENGQTEYSIYKRYSRSVNTDEISFIVEGEEYELYEKGIATVKDYFGNADVDIHEKCQYIDYATKDQKHLISVEIWEDDMEKTQGEYIDKTRINITKEMDSKQIEADKKIEKEKKSFRRMVIITFSISIAFAVIYILSSGIIVNKSIQKYIKKNSNYTYITSVTNNTNKKKAKVYQSPYSTIDQTVKDIIDGVPEGITDTIDAEPNTDTDGIGLHTDKEFAYVYLENQVVYVQVSEKAYVGNHSGSTYHGSHYGYYYRAYTSNRRNTTYYDYSYSARQQSINSRLSSGGGTSAGK